jgi:hypothetical protein
MPLGVLPRHDWLDATVSHRRLNVANAEVVPKAGALRSRLRLAFPSGVIEIGAPLRMTDCSREWDAGWRLGLLSTFVPI